MNYQAAGAYGFADTGGVCRPTTNETRAKFVLYQQLLNDVAGQIGASKIGADGVIGSKTLSLHAKVFPYDPAVLTGTLSCSYVGSSIDASIQAAKDRYTQVTGKAPKSHAPVKPAAPAAPGQPLPPARTGGIIELLSNPFVLGGVGVGVFLLLKGQKKPRRRKR